MPDETTQDRKGPDAERAIPGKAAGKAAGERGAPENAGRLPEQDPQGDTMRPHGDELRDQALRDDSR